MREELLRIIEKNSRIDLKELAVMLDANEIDVANELAAKVVSYDLHADPVLMEGNIMTEYEEKFSALGNPICKYIIYR